MNITAKKPGHGKIKAAVIQSRDSTHTCTQHACFSIHPCHISVQSRPLSSHPCVLYRSPHCSACCSGISCHQSAYPLANQHIASGLVSVHCVAPPAGHWFLYPSEVLRCTYTKRGGGGKKSIGVKGHDVPACGRMCMDVCEGVCVGANEISAHGIVLEAYVLNVRNSISLSRVVQHLWRTDVPSQLQLSEMKFYLLGSV